MDKKKTTLIIGIMVFAIVALTIFLIVIIATSGSKNNTNTQAKVDQVLELTDNKKVEINDQLLNDYMIQFLIAEKFGIDTSIKDDEVLDVDVYAQPKVEDCTDSEFTDKQMLNTAAAILIEQSNKSIKEENNVYTLKVDDVQEQAKILFDKEIELTRVSNKVQNGYVEVDINPDIDLIPYKVKEIKFNKTTSEYTITFDYVKYTQENYAANKIDYDSSDVMATYFVKVKAINDTKNLNKVNYIFVSMGC